MRAACATIATLALVYLHGCTFKPNMPSVGGGSPDGATVMTGVGGAGGSTAGGRGGMPGAMCMNLQCQQTSCRNGPCTGMPCAGGARTTLTGIVYDPAGKVPLYNVLVYVPNAALVDLVDGASCDRCETSASGSPITKTTTDSRGQFVLDDVPVGTDIPLVMQVGKWRRQVTIPSVAACVDNMVADKDLTRLPRNKSEGHIPKIALTTGAWDALECLLRKIGIEDGEFTTETGTGRVNLFNGAMGTDRYDTPLGGAMFTPAPTWWESQANLMGYDIVLHSCEGIERSTNKSAAARAALQAYADAGGRVFASHWHNYWIEQGPAAFQSTAQFAHSPTDPPSPFTATIDTSFPKGMAMAEWLSNVGASTTLGQLDIVGAKRTVASVTANLAQRWIYSTNPASVQYFSFNTPVGSLAGAECGKVVFSDLHLAGAVGMTKGLDLSQPDKPFPTGCTTTELTPQEKALEFMLFDLSACLEPRVP